jgi:hypothetical protein
VQPRQQALQLRIVKNAHNSAPSLPHSRPLDN